MKKWLPLCLCLTVLLSGAVACRRIPANTPGGSPVADSSAPDAENPPLVSEGDTSDTSNIPDNSDATTNGGWSWAGGSTTAPATPGGSGAEDNEGALGTLPPEKTTGGAATTTTKTATSTTANTTTTTTAAPQASVNGVSLPAVGFQPLGNTAAPRKNLVVSQSSCNGNQVSLKLTNKDTSCEVDEESYLRYTCYDKNGKSLSSGNVPLGRLVPGASVSASIRIPDGTAKMTLSEGKVDFWSGWK